MLTFRVRSGLRVAFTVFVCLTLVAFSILQLRYGASVLGLLSKPKAVSSIETLDTSEVDPLSGFTVTVEYCSETAAENDPVNPSGRTSTKMYFNDSWFFTDSYTYNHDLATACATLSAVCNSESQFYGSVAGSDPYAEKALGSLGFSNIRTESYELRSDLLDQVAALFVSPHDVAAYALASKTIPGQAGKPDQTIVFVGIRGSYGIEWLSNFKLFGSNENLDHTGFKLAEKEVKQALDEYLYDIGAHPDSTKILITGHSRGGAIANLLAADLINESTNKATPVSANDIYTYTFAAPCSTQNPQRDDAEYNNIFNIVNPSDIVPHLTISSEEFGRYGTRVTLPQADEEEFTLLYEKMQTAYENNTGFQNSCSEADLRQLSGLGSSNKAPSVFDTLMSIQGLGSFFQTISGVGLNSVCGAHYPDTYIAWLQTLKTNDLSIS